MATRRLSEATFTQEQRRVFDWLNSELQLPTYAEAYAGAVYLMKARPPGYINLVAHFGRDLMNGLARTFAVDVRKQAQYHQLIDDLDGVWRDEWGGRGLTTPDDSEDGYLIPYDACQIVQKLIDERKAARERNKGAVVLFFSKFFEYDAQVSPPDNFLQHWEDARDWFRERAHVPNKPFHDGASLELGTHFGTLHGLLHNAASSAFQRWEVINEILAEANG